MSPASEKLYKLTSLQLLLHVGLPVVLLQLEVLQTRTEFVENPAADMGYPLAMIA